MGAATKPYAGPRVALPHDGTDRETLRRELIIEREQAGGPMDLI